MHLVRSRRPEIGNGDVASKIREWKAPLQRIRIEVTIDAVARSFAERSSAILTTDVII
jgi:hypothetical protein